MGIFYQADKHLFHLQTPDTSYVIGVLDEKHLLHLYYGKRIDEYGDILENFPILGELSFSGKDVPEHNMSTNILPMEYPCYGSVDFRSPAFHAEYQNGSSVTCFAYEGYEIFKGKKKLSGLPATYVEEESEADTLEITLCDPLTNIRVVLSYTVFAHMDAIAKSVRVKNDGRESVNLKSVLSSTIHLFDKNYEFVHLEGAWARERSVQKRPLLNGIMQIDSKRVSSGHYHSPFLALARPYATETQGDVYGFSFVYSGNHLEQVDVNEFDVTRVNVGINPFGFLWQLLPGEEFQAPEVILTYSDQGLGKMSRTYHKLYRTRLCRGKYRDAERPVLINNWEATYMNFNEEKILKIASKAQSVGIDLMVLDDGWFGNRNSDDSSLGDWVVDKNKLPNGIESLATKVNELGMQFGLWFEPEMISENSDLYRKHPDWCVHIDGRPRIPTRQQLVLDLTRPEIRDYVVDAVCSVLKSAPISYVKWDMNRNITEIGSKSLPPERQQEFAHRYVLGLYEVLERITSAFPEVLFEGSSGGGGRFDAGMLYYQPQYWTSDNTDGVERLSIQYGTGMVMPASSMGAHISAVPNHQVGRTTPLVFRGHVAMAGQFGYELDLNTLSLEEIETVKQQIKQYKDIRNVIQKGEFYRLANPFEGRNASWEFVHEDRVVLMYYTIRARSIQGKTCVKLCGLDPTAKYIESTSKKVYSGLYLMNVGLYFEDNKDYTSSLMVFQKL